MRGRKREKGRGGGKEREKLGAMLTLVEKYVHM